MSHATCRFPIQVVVTRVVDLDDSDSSNSDAEGVRNLPPPKPAACARVRHGIQTLRTRAGYQKANLNTKLILSIINGYQGDKLLTISAQRLKFSDIHIDIDVMHKL